MLTVLTAAPVHPCAGRDQDLKNSHRTPNANGTPRKTARSESCSPRDGHAEMRKEPRHTPKPCLELANTTEQPRKPAPAQPPPANKTTTFVAYGFLWLLKWIWDLRQQVSSVQPKQGCECVPMFVACACGWVEEIGGRPDGCKHNRRAALV